MVWLDSAEAEGFGPEGRGAGEDVGGHGSLGSVLDAGAGEASEVGGQSPEALDGRGRAGGSASPGGPGACGAASMP